MPRKSRDENKTTINLSTIINNETNKAIVQIEWGAERAQLTPLQAVQHALAILEVAEAARTDELVLNWLQETVGMDRQNAMGAMASLRDARINSRVEK